MLKRSLDILVSLTTIIIFSPIMIIVSVLVSFKLGSPVVFSQLRPGLNAKLFRMYKFRTMTDAVNDVGETLPDVERLTPFGNKLRLSSLDELPGLWNVLKGDMSLVGPRPLLPKYYEYYTEREQLRHTVRPGVTGWAQVNGRNTLNWDDRLAMDVLYVENQSLYLDFKILLLTIKKVTKSEGVVVDARSVMQNLDEERKNKSTQHNGN
jgi:lipopolysaccharide/colanic/teichoic acid biosynthesis glycosyltransferase